MAESGEDIDPGYYSPEFDPLRHELQRLEEIFGRQDITTNAVQSRVACLEQRNQREVRQSKALVLEQHMELLNGVQTIDDIREALKGSIGLCVDLRQRLRGATKEVSSSISIAELSRKRRNLMLLQSLMSTLQIVLESKQKLAECNDQGDYTTAVQCAVGLQQILAELEASAGDSRLLLISDLQKSAEEHAKGTVLAMRHHLRRLLTGEVDPSDDGFLSMLDASLTMQACNELMNPPLHAWWSSLELEVMDAASEEVMAVAGRVALRSGLLTAGGSTLLSNDDVVEQLCRSEVDEKAFVGLLPELLAAMFRVLQAYYWLCSHLHGLWKQLELLEQEPSGLTDGEGREEAADGSHVEGGDPTPLQNGAAVLAAAYERVDTVPAGAHAEEAAEEGDGGQGVAEQKWEGPAPGEVQRDAVNGQHSVEQPAAIRSEQQTGAEEAADVGGQPPGTPAVDLERLLQERRAAAAGQALQGLLHERWRLLSMTIRPVQVLLSCGAAARSYRAYPSADAGASGQETAPGGFMAALHQVLMFRDLRSRFLPVGDKQQQQQQLDPLMQVLVPGFREFHRRCLDILRAYWDRGSWSVKRVKPGEQAELMLASAIDADGPAEDERELERESEGEGGGHSCDAGMRSFELGFRGVAEMCTASPFLPQKELPAGCPEGGVEAAHWKPEGGGGHARAQSWPGPSAGTGEKGLLGREELRRPQDDTSGGAVAASQADTDASEDAGGAAGAFWDMPLGCFHLRRVLRDYVTALRLLPSGTVAILDGMAELFELYFAKLFLDHGRFTLAQLAADHIPPHVMTSRLHNTVRRILSSRQVRCDKEWAEAQQQVAEANLAAAKAQASGSASGLRGAVRGASARTTGAVFGVARSESSPVPTLKAAASSPNGGVQMSDGELGQKMRALESLVELAKELRYVLAQVRERPQLAQDTSGVQGDLQASFSKDTVEDVRDALFKVFARSLLGSIVSHDDGRLANDMAAEAYRDVRVVDRIDGPALWVRRVAGKLESVRQCLDCLLTGTREDGSRAAATAAQRITPGLILQMWREVTEQLDSELVEGLSRVEVSTLEGVMRLDTDVADVTGQLIRNGMQLLKQGLHLLDQTAAVGGPAGAPEADAADTNQDRLVQEVSHPMVRTAAYMQILSVQGDAPIGRDREQERKVLARLEEELERKLPQFGMDKCFKAATNCLKANGMPARKCDAALAKMREKARLQGL